MTSAPKIRAGAFSLIELLTVIALMGTLSAMLFPVFARAKKAAKAASCISNLRHIGLGIVLYAGDFDDKYPSATDAASANTACPNAVREKLPLVQTVMVPYLPTLTWHCPLDTGVPRLSPAQYEEPAECDLPGIASIYLVYGSSYLYRSDLARAGVAEPASLFSIEEGHEEHPPATVPVFFDTYGLWHGGNAGAERFYNAAFAEGHVKRINRSQLAISESWVPRTQPGSKGMLAYNQNLSS
jgi:type II secretory pathway pseudopilin PulG